MYGLKALYPSSEKPCAKTERYFILRPTDMNNTSQGDFPGTTETRRDELNLLWMPFREMCTVC